MSAEKSKFVFNRLVVEKLPVTTPFLSRCWNIPSKNVAAILDQFYTENKNREEFKNASVKYSVCGTQKCVDKANRHADVLIKVIDVGELDTLIENEFATVQSSQIYSISIDDGKTSLSNQIEICKTCDQYLKWTPTTDNLQSCGLIQTETYGVIDSKEQTKLEDTKQISTNKSQNGQGRSHTAPVKPSTSSIKAENTDSSETRRPVYVSRKAASNPSSTETNKPLYVSRKDSSVSKSNSGTAKRKDTQTATEAKSSKKAKTVTEAEREKLEEEKKALEEMLKDDIDFDDEDDDFKDGVVVSGEPGNDEKEVEDDYEFSDIDVAEPEKATEKLQKEEINVDDKLISEKDSNIIQGKNQDVDDAPVVPATDTYTDADGYIVRKVNRKEPPKPKATSEKRSFTIDTNSTSSKAPKKQSNLMSFFKKK